MSAGSRRTVALVTAPALIEEWLDEIGTSLEGFRDTLTGGWMFNYVEALDAAGINTVIVCFSTWVDRPERFEHAPTGAAVWMLPPARRFPTVKRWMSEPPLLGARDPRSVVRGLRRHVAPYGLTPLRSTLRVLREERCDAILSQDYHSQRFDLCLLLARRCGIPAFATFQGGFFPPSFIAEAVRPLSVRLAAGLIIPARREAERVRARYGLPAEKIASVPNPLDVDLWRAQGKSEARAALGISADATVVVTHGRVDIDDKGLDVLLDAWARLRAGQADADMRLLIVGRGHDSERVKEMIASGPYEGAELVDEFIKEGDRLRTYLSAADAFAFAGRYEGFPVAPTEAMACGLPLAASDANGISDLLPDGEESGGTVVPRDDPAALAAALERILRDPARARAMGQRARERVESFCSLARVGSELDAFMTRRGMRPA